MVRHRGTTMNKAKKSKFSGATGHRNPGGRPRKSTASSSHEEPAEDPSPSSAAMAANEPVHVPSEPIEADPTPAPEPAPEPEAQPWEPTPTDAPSGGWRCRAPLALDTVPSGIVKPKFLTRVQAEQKAQLKRRYPWQNGICSCTAGPTSSADSDADHSMFCQLYRCYAREVGCCEGGVFAQASADDPKMTYFWDCDCIAHAFDPYWDVGGEGADLLVSRARRRTRGHVDEDGMMDRPGGHALRCTCDCEFVSGPYVPMCPFRPHAVTGLARGDMYPRLRAFWGGRNDWEWPEPPDEV